MNSSSLAPNNQGEGPRAEMEDETISQGWDPMDIEE
jgi:hypothetical protein